MAEAQPNSTSRTGITLERALYAVALVTGLAARLFGLGAAPLAPLEAANAWPAWLKAVGLSAPLAAEPSSPLMYSLHVLMFWLAPTGTSGGDAWARLPAVVAGMALVLLPWFLRDRLGRRTALVLTFLLALDPWLVTFSRLADGTILALLWAMLALVALERTRMATTAADADGQWRWLQVLAVALGLLLVSGATAWPLLAVIALNVALLGSPPVDLAGLRTAGRPPLFLLILGGGAALLGSTVWLAQPGALSNVGASLSWWWQRPAIEAGPGYSFTWLWLRLLVDQPFVLVFGAIGLVMLARRGATRRDFLFLAAWLSMASLLLLLPTRDPLLLPLWAMPLLPAAAVAVDRWIGRVPAGLAWQEVGIVLLVSVALLLSITFWLRIWVAAFQVDFSALAIVTLLLAAVALIVVVYGLWAGGPAARWVLGVLLMLVLLTANWSAMWHLAHEADAMHPDGFFLVETHPDVRNLATELATLSAQRTGDAAELPVQVQMAASADPVLGWTLRDMGR
ncbi:MAG: hypothetical protein KDE20_22915, partial [Caldilineaceae bacterium]|nr:hypothetical protein [Caldilineaceae bacterium]